MRIIMPMESRDVVEGTADLGTFVHLVVEDCKYDVHQRTGNRVLIQMTAEEAERLAGVLALLALAAQGEFGVRDVRGMKKKGDA